MTYEHHVGYRDGKMNKPVEAEAGTLARPEAMVEMLKAHGVEVLCKSPGVLGGPPFTVYRSRQLTCDPSMASQ